MNTEEFTHAFKLLWNNPLLVIFTTLLDTLFLVFYGFFTQPVRETLLVFFQNFTTVLSQVIQDAGARYETPSLFELALSPAAKPYLAGVASWLFILFLVGYILYVLFQGTIWRTTSALLHGRKSYWAYLQQFALLNAIWFLIFGFVKLVLDILDLRAALLMSITKTASWYVPFGVRVALFSVLAYFALLSYAELQNLNWKDAFKSAFSNGTKKFTSFLPFVVVTALVFLALQFVIAPLVIFPLMQFNEALGLTLSIVILGPIAFWLRVCVTALVSRAYVR